MIKGKSYKALCMNTGCPEHRHNNDNSIQSCDHSIPHAVGEGCFHVCYRWNNCTCSLVEMEDGGKIKFIKLLE